HKAGDFWGVCGREGRVGVSHNDSPLWRSYGSLAPTRSFTGGLPVEPRWVPPRPAELSGLNAGHWPAPQSVVRTDSSAVADCAATTLLLSGLQAAEMPALRELP